MKLILKNFENNTDIYKLRITKDFENNEKDIKTKYDNMYIIYNPKMKKMFKEWRKDGTPIFTEKYKYVNLFNVDSAYLTKQKLLEFINKNPSKKYIKKIIDNNLVICIFEFKE